MHELQPHPPSNPRRRTILTFRHAAVTRLTHWVNALCLTILLMSGLQILNAYPRLHWGQYGADADAAIVSIDAGETDGEPRGFATVAGIQVPTTGVLGVSKVDGEWTQRAFPAWATLPSYQDLALGRRWHFFFAWTFVLNGLIYLAYSMVSGHFRRDLAPRRGELAPRHLWREVLDHARLRFPSGEDARHYNALQKLSYVAVIGGLLPLMVLTGLTMSPGVDAAAPFLLDVFGGRQSARTVHFLCASLLVLFVAVHVAMVVLSGPWNNLRSMITGRYAIREEGPRT